MELNFFGKIFLISYLFVNCVAGPVTSNEENGKLLKKSREMRSFMNESIDPCENFYEFACGNWANIHPADNDTDLETDYLLVIKKAFDMQAIAILTDTVESDAINTDIDRKVKNFYKSCVKLKNGVKAEKLIGVITEFGKMPALVGADWDEKEFDWLETLAKIIHRYNSKIMIGLDILPDMRDNSKNRIYIGEVKFDMESKSIYLDDVGEFYRLMYKMAVALKLYEELGVEPDVAEDVADEIVEFEILLAKGMLESKSDRNLNSLLFNTTAEEMQQKYAPTIDIKKFLNITLGEIPNEMIYEYVPDYMLNLKRVVETTEKRIIANYIFYHLVKDFLMKTENEEELSKVCLDKVKERFAKNIDNMIYRSFDSKAAEQDLQRIWNELKILFKEKLQSSTALKWLTNTTRQAAIEKLNTLTMQINSYMDWDFKKHFEGLETNDDYIENLKNIMTLETKCYMAKLSSAISPIDAGKELSLTPANILIENTVKIPVALLQPYFVWAPNFPDALKFGITGFLLAHELIHTFDETGRQFGKRGNLEDWWDSESATEFQKRKECFTDQYQKYVYGNRQLPRSELQGENIADNSGLKLAYDAYKNAQKNMLQRDHEMLGMNYTNKQLFFIGFAQFWCNDLQEILLNLQTEVDDHTPGKFRVIGTVSNLEEFSEAFECKIGSKMNPTNECEMY